MDYKEDYGVIKKVYNNLYSKNRNFTAIDIVGYFKKIQKLNWLI